MAGRRFAMRLWCRFNSSSATPSSSVSTSASTASGDIGVREFLNGVGNGVEVHAEKFTGQIDNLRDLLRIRSGRLKKMGIPCQQRKLILRYTEKYRQGVWRPKIMGK